MTEEREDPQGMTTVPNTNLRDAGKALRRYTEDANSTREGLQEILTQIREALGSSSRPDSEGDEKSREEIQALASSIEELKSTYKAGAGANGEVLERVAQGLEGLSQRLGTAEGAYSSLKKNILGAVEGIPEEIKNDEFERKVYERIADLGARLGNLESGGRQIAQALTEAGVLYVEHMRLKKINSGLIRRVREAEENAETTIETAREAEEEAEILRRRADELSSEVIALNEELKDQNKLEEIIDIAEDDRDTAVREVERLQSEAIHYRVAGQLRDSYKGDIFSDEFGLQFDIDGNSYTSVNVEGKKLRKGKDLPQWTISDGNTLYIAHSEDGFNALQQARQDKTDCLGSREELEAVRSKINSSEMISSLPKVVDEQGRVYGLHDPHWTVDEDHSEDIRRIRDEGNLVEYEVQHDGNTYILIPEKITMENFEMLEWKVPYENQIDTILAQRRTN